MLDEEPGDDEESVQNRFYANLPSFYACVNCEFPHILGDNFAVLFVLGRFSSVQEHEQEHYFLTLIELTKVHRCYCVCGFCIDQFTSLGNYSWK